MFEVISIAEACMTRYVHLRNCETGAIEHCFDDSDVRDEDQKDFWFMKVGERYDCKIMLFGGPLEPDEEITEKCMVCRQIGPMEKLAYIISFQLKAEEIYIILPMMMLKK